MSFTSSRFSFLEQYPLLLKFIFIGLLILVLWIPSTMIKNLIEEREARHQETRQEITKSWGAAQTLGGVVLNIPYQNYEACPVVPNTVYSSGPSPQCLSPKLKYATFLPSELKVEGELKTQTLYRGIFKAPVYTGDFSLSGSFAPPDFSKITNQKIKVLWQQARVLLLVSDKKALRQRPALQWEGSEYDFSSLDEEHKVWTAALQVKLPLQKKQNSAFYPFHAKLQMVGSQGIHFLSLAKDTQVSLKSKWKHPSFTGAFLPNNRQVGSKGFSAQWQIPHLARNLPQAFPDFAAHHHTINASKFGAGLVLPIDIYQLSDRSLKYSLLFITLTFVVFFLFEVLSKLRIHPIQYLLVGFALILFYLLLLSLSEHMGFNFAYWLASIATVLSITIYVATILQKKSRAGVMALILSVLYVFLYVLLQAEDFSLVMGSAGLFVILSVIMFLTRKIDWYRWQDSVLPSSTKAEEYFEEGSA